MSLWMELIAKLLFKAARTLVEAAQAKFAAVQSPDKDFQSICL